LTQEHFNEYLRKGIPTEYNGTKFKSRLEANVAYFLDGLKIEWQYEPQSFLLKIGHYMPDFYLPQLRTWIEVKGKIDKKAWQTIQELSKTTKQPIILFGSREAWFIGETWGFQDFSQLDPKERPKEISVDIEKQELYVGHCLNCGHWFFCGQIGVYHCRCCGFHNGKHDIKGGFIFYNFEGHDVPFFWTKNHDRLFNFSDFETIEEITRLLSE